jgi:cbb3-type cytochrome oxidase subunit 3
MFKHIIKTMGDVDWMALVPLILFVSVFSIASILWLKRSKKEVAKMANLPLEDGTKN